LLPLPNGSFELGGVGAGLAPGAGPGLGRSIGAPGAGGIGAVGDGPGAGDGDCIGCDPLSDGVAAELVPSSGLFLPQAVAATTGMIDSVTAWNRQ
jgi:hypothetical protein